MSPSWHRATATPDSFTVAICGVAGILSVSSAGRPVSWAALLFWPPRPMLFALVTMAIFFLFDGDVTGRDLAVS
jgi:hypothetical protein